VVVRPVAGVGQHHLGAFGHTCFAQLSFCGGDDRLELLDVTSSVVISAATMICSAANAAWAL
jgi:hypothetical protein